MKPLHLHAHRGDAPPVSPSISRRAKADEAAVIETPYRSRSGSSQDVAMAFDWLGPSQAGHVVGASPMDQRHATSASWFGRSRTLADSYSIPGRSENSLYWEIRVRSAFPSGNAGARERKMGRLYRLKGIGDFSFDFRATSTVYCGFSSVITTWVMRFLVATDQKKAFAPMRLVCVPPNSRQSTKRKFIELKKYDRVVVGGGTFIGGKPA